MVDFGCIKKTVDGDAETGGETRGDGSGTPSCPQDSSSNATISVGPAAPHC